MQYSQHVLNELFDLSGQVRRSIWHYFPRMFSHILHEYTVYPFIASQVAALLVSGENILRYAENRYKIFLQMLQYSSVNTESSKTMNEILVLISSELSFDTILIAALVLVFLILLRGLTKRRQAQQIQQQAAAAQP